MMAIHFADSSRSVRDALIRGVHDLLEDLGSFVGAINIILAVRGDSS
jgi:hypothetical protein